MAEKKPKRGGSDTARELGLTGVVAHFTPDERYALGQAAAQAAVSVKAFVRRAAVEAARVAGFGAAKKKPQQRD